jgi:UrcA family protein
MFKKVILAAASVAITGAGMIAMAPEALAKEQTATVTAINDPDVITRRISYADLNLASLQGETTLNRRVGAAVGSLCYEMFPGAPSFWNNRCRNTVLNDARPQMESAVMRAREIAKLGRSSLAATAITLTFRK